MIVDGSGQIRNDEVYIYIDERPKIASSETISAKCNNDKIVFKLKYNQKRNIERVNISINNKEIDRSDYKRILRRLDGKEIAGASINTCSYPIKNRTFGIKILSVASFKISYLRISLRFRDNKWHVIDIADSIN